MTIQEAKKEYGQDLVEATLCLCIKHNQLLLARKMKKIGAGLWNGPGGKIESGERIEEAMIRGAEEKLGITPTTYSKAAELIFYFPTQPEWHMKCQVFLVNEWEGEPTATDEMSDPSWFTYDALPMEEMWATDQIWVPLVLQGESIEAVFIMGEGNTILEHEITVNQ